ncbi:MAG TPA: HEAT repeat domain-containing protein [Planctomycetota bacterium]|nr:HEAT repeat domain-containing protein [Planctomycetota bacterium]
MSHRLLSMLGVLLLATGVAAQDAAPADAPADAPTDAPRAPVDPQTRTARRLLHAPNGGVLREECRLVDDHWEVKRDGRWTALPAGLVVSARAEDEALAEWRQRKSDARKGDAAAQVAVAEWGVEQGLYKEALAQLDDVLEADPDQPDARALLQSDELHVGLPAGAAPLDFAAKAPPALRELALTGVVSEARAADEVTLQALHDDLGTRLLDRQPGNREMAALALRRLAAGAEPPVSGYSEAELAELLRRSVRDVSPDVRRQASLALRDAQDEALLLPLFKALGSRSSAIRTNAAQAMAEMGHRRAVEPLVVRLLTLQSSGGEGFSAPRSNIFVGRQIAFVQGFDVEVAQNAAIGKPMVGTLQDGVSLDVAVMGASGGGGAGYLQEGEALCKALEKLTGAHPGRTKADWQRWWNENRGQWVVAESAGAVESEGAGR